MTGEYDLVIIGGSYAARYAAGMAVQQRVRVALVEPDLVEIQPFSWGEIYQAHLRSPASRNIYTENLQNLQNLQSGDLEIVGNLERTGDNFGGAWRSFLQYSQTAANFLQEEFDLASLSRAGVDVIVGRGEFQQGSRRSALAFVVDKRILRSRRYLLATELISAPPSIPGLEEASYLTPADLSKNLTANSWIVMGNPYPAAEISLMLRGLGKAVTLISPKRQLFPQEEPIANALIQGELEAAGILLLTNSPVALIRYLEGKSWVQAGDRAIEAEQLLLCPRQIYQTRGLNLATAGVQTNKYGMVVNQYLQTTNPRIYAWSDPQNSALAEVQTALKNALMLPLFSFNSLHQPRITHTQPTLARIGMTEQEARQKHGQSVTILREYVKNQPLAQMRGETTGFCQLVVGRNGKILGATVLAAQGAELMTAIALAINTGLKVGDLARIPETNGSLLQRTAAQGRSKHPQFDSIWQEIMKRFKV